MSVWEKFENIVTAEEIAELSKKEYEKPAEGKHTVELLSVEPSETSNGVPIVKFKYMDLDTHNQIFASMFLQNMYYPESTAREINKVLAVLRKLGNPIDFVSMADLEKHIMETKLGGKYEINVSYKKSTDKYPIIEIVREIKDEYVIDDSLSDEDMPL